MHERPLRMGLDDMTPPVALIYRHSDQKAVGAYSEAELELSLRFHRRQGWECTVFRPEQSVSPEPESAHRSQDLCPPEQNPPTVHYEYP